MTLADSLQMQHNLVGVRQQRHVAVVEDCQHNLAGIRQQKHVLLVEGCQYNIVDTRQQQHVVEDRRMLTLVDHNCYSYCFL